VIDPLVAEVLPVPQEPAFVSYLMWRASDPIVTADLDLLVVALMQVDAEVCLQMPTDAAASLVVSLGSMSTGYYEAAVETARLLLAATTVLGIDAQLIEADVCSEEGQAHFDRKELIDGLES